MGEIDIKKRVKPEKSLVGKVNITCPRCGKNRVVKDGKNRHQKQNYKCCGCSRQFSLNPGNKVSPFVKDIILRMLEEKIPVPVIARITKVSRSVVYKYRKMIT